MNRRHVEWWALALGALVVFAAQTALADSDVVTVRYAIACGVLVLAAAFGTHAGGRSWRAVAAAPAEPVVLLLCALAGLSVWLVAWWAMDLTNYALDELAGNQPLPQALIAMQDSLLGWDIQAAAYELQIAFGVVLIPLAQAWLLGGVAQPALAGLVGRWRAAWIVGLAGGGVIALTAVQRIAFALPWGLASLPGYVLVSVVAAMCVYLTGSAWSGFAVLGTFAYASFTWWDARWFQDLFAFARFVDYFGLTWLTVLLLGGFGTVAVLQIVRYRVPRPADPPRARNASLREVAGPLILLLVGVIVLAALDIQAR